MTYVSGAVLLLTSAWIVWVHGLPADFLTRNAFNWPGFLGTISAAALWQIAYAPYVPTTRATCRATPACARILGELLGLHAGLVAADGAGRHGRPGGAEGQSRRGPRVA